MMSIESIKTQMQLATEQILNERQKFLIVGLTGKTASGCSTAAKLLSSSFSDLSPPKPKSSDYFTTEERKYEIVYNYSKYNWRKFETIKVRNIITTFLLDYDFETFYFFLISAIRESKITRRDQQKVTMKDCEYLLKIAENHDLNVNHFLLLKELVNRNSDKTLHELVVSFNPLNRFSQSSEGIDRNEKNIFIEFVETIQKSVDYIDKNDHKRLYKAIDDLQFLVNSNLRSDIETFINDFTPSFEFLRKIRNEVKNYYTHIETNKNSAQSLYDRPELYLVIRFFYLELLPYLSQRLEIAFSEISPKLFSKVLQLIGNNIRCSGTPYYNEFNPENIYELSNRINNLIKMLRDGTKLHKLISDKKNDISTLLHSYAIAKKFDLLVIELKENDLEVTNIDDNLMDLMDKFNNDYLDNFISSTNVHHTFVVVDAFRNPFEVAFFKDRYSSFHLISINTDEKTREERLLTQKKLNLEDIKDIDNTESPVKLNGISKFTNQNIPDCLQISDIHLYNPQNLKEHKNFLKKQLIKYISLILHPGLITPSHEERCMQFALNAKVNSGCLSRQVGAIVTDSNFSIKSVGWNDVPEGQISCNLKNMEKLLRNEDTASFSEYELSDVKFREYIYNSTSNQLKESAKHNDRFFSFCFKDIQNGLEGEKNQVHTRSLHAEENAFLQLSKYGGNGIQGGYLFTTASPCELCSKKSYQLGIKRIFYIDQYPGISKKHILNNGTNIPELKLFNGAVGKTYHQLFTPIMPLKDELYELFDIKFKPIISD